MRRPTSTHAAALAALLAIAAGCSSPIPNRDPVDERFPSVDGNSLAGESVELPEDLAGSPAILLVGYVQNAQFDIDRWLLGLLQADADVRLLEIPTVRGLVPSLLSERIDSGMRSGIPEEAWSDVVTVYDDAEAIVALTGNERPRNARVLLLDPEGRIAWFHDRGYSPNLALELAERARALEAGGGSRPSEAPPTDAGE